MADCCLIKKVATVEVYENKNEVRAYGFMAGDRNTPVMEVRFKHLWGESNLSSCKLRWIIVDDVGSLLVGEVPIQSDNTALINLPNELFTGDRRMKVQLTVASCDGERILNLQQFTDLKVINSLAPNEVVEPVYQILINQLYDESQKYLKELETSYTQKYGSLDSLYKSARASLEQYLITAENGGNAEFLQGYSPVHFQKVENTINDLIDSTKYEVGDVVEVLGYYAKGDGSHHKRVAKAEDDGSGEQGQNGILWCIVHSGEVNVSWLGVEKTNELAAPKNTEVVQKFLDYEFLNGREGSTILFDRGVYYFNHIGLYSTQILKGVSKDSTIIRKNSINPTFSIKGGFVYAKEEKRGETGVFTNTKTRIEKVHIDGAGSDEVGIMFKGGYEEVSATEQDSWIWVDDVRVRNFGKDGIQFGGKYRESRILNSRINTNGGNGLTFASTDSFIQNCTFHSNKKNGCRILDDDMRLVNCKAFYNLENGFFINGEASLSSCSSQENKLHGFNVSSYTHVEKKAVSLSSCYSSSNGIDTSTNTVVADSYGFYVGDGYNVSINGAIISDFRANSSSSKVMEGALKVSGQRSSVVANFSFGIGSTYFDKENIINFDSYVSQEKSIISINGESVLSGSNEYSLSNNNYLKLASFKIKKATSTNTGFTCGVVINNTKNEKTNILTGNLNFRINPTTKICSFSTDVEDIGQMQLSITPTKEDSEYITYSLWAKPSQSYSYFSWEIINKRSYLCTYYKDEESLVDRIEITPSFIGWGGVLDMTFKTSTLLDLDTPYYATKMQQEGIYEDYINYRDELQEYENSQTTDETMLLPVLHEPIIPESVKAFAKKYNLI